MSRTNARTVSTSFSVWSRSTLLITMTTFLPHSRICARNWRSLSVKGRSAEVTNSTRSARGTNRRVSSPCARVMALVPGVSTTWMSRSRGAEARSWRTAPGSGGGAWSACRSSCTSAVVGVTPSSRMRSPSSALTSALLPELNSPTTTSRKKSSSCCSDCRSVASSSASASVRASAPSSSCSTPRTRRTISVCCGVSTPAASLMAARSYRRCRRCARRARGPAAAVGVFCTNRSPRAIHARRAAVVRRAGGAT